MVMVKKKLPKHYIVNKEVLRRNAKTNCRNLSEEEKEAKRECGSNVNINMIEDEITD